MQKGLFDFMCVGLNSYHLGRATFLLASFSYIWQIILQRSGWSKHCSTGSSCPWRSFWLHWHICERCLKPPTATIGCWCAYSDGNIGHWQARPVAIIAADSQNAADAVQEPASYLYLEVCLSCSFGVSKQKDPIALTTNLAILLLWLPILLCPALQALRSMGFHRVANLHTQDFVGTSSLIQRRGKRLGQWVLRCYT